MNNKGKLIVVDGLGDGCGKETQSKMLVEKLRRDGLDVRHISFPCYDKWHSVFVSKYLGGNFGYKASDVNAYQASLFYALDRYASFLEDWKNDYEKGVVIVCDRYTTSNIVHQATKLEGGLRNHFITWLENLEYGILGIPKPDIVVCLDLDVEHSISVMNERKENKSEEISGDIHENDIEYIRKCYLKGSLVADRLGWTRVKCNDGLEYRNKKDISLEVYNIVINYFNNNK